MAAPVTIRNLRDSFVNEARPSRNFINLNRLKLCNNTGERRFAYLYFGKPWPNGATITSAKLRVWNVGAWSGSVTLTAQVLSESWAGNKITWDKRPTATWPTYTQTISGAPANTMWEIDITPMIQSVANGSAWYGLRLSTNGSALRNLYSTQAAVEAYRPQVVVQWSDAPEPPENLSPGGGRVAPSPKPLLSYTFTDVSGDVSLAEHQIQLATTEGGFNTPTLDTGWIPTGAPEFDLSTSAYAGLAPGELVWWRVRVRDGAGIMSSWSEPTSFSYQPLGTITPWYPNIPAQPDYTNYVPNPSGRVNATGWNTWAGTGGAGAILDQAVGLGEDGDNCLQVSGWTTLPTEGGGFLTGVLPYSSGTTHLFASVRVKTTQPVAFRPYFQFYDSSGTPTYNKLPDDPVPLIAVPGFWLNLSTKVTLTPSETTSDRVLVRWYMDDHTGTGYLAPLNPGFTILWEKGMVVSSDQPLDFFDGDTTPEFPGQYAWTGTPNNSPSTKLGYPIVVDSSPPILWTFSGTQTAYRVVIYDQANPTSPVFDTGKITSTDSWIDTSQQVLTRLDGLYRFELYVWDNYLREKVGGVGVAAEYITPFRFEPGVTDPINSLTMTVNSPWPWVTLEFTRDDAPDSFSIIRDGEVIASGLEPGELMVPNSLGTYRYVDRTASPRVNHIWKVAAEVNHELSPAPHSVAGRTRPLGTWLMEEDGSNPIILLKSASTPSPVVEAQPRTMQEVHQPVGGGNPVLITQYQSGYEGRVDAVLSDGITELTARQMRDSLKEWKRNPGKVLTLFAVDEVIRIVPYNISYRSRAKSGGKVIYDVGFDFFEVS